jgi:pteridine reductase
MMNSIQNTALITGAAIRLGRGIALKLAASGYNIALHYNSSEKEAGKTKIEIETAGVKCGLFKCDLSYESEALSLIDKVFMSFPDLNVLINNASVFLKAGIKESDPELFNKIININFKAPVFLAKKFAEIIGKGNIINILDAKIIEKNSKYSIYNLSKKMLHEFTLTAAKEFSPDIRVNAVSPGFILGPESESGEYFNKMLKNRSILKNGKIEDINNAIEFLLKNQYINGQIIYIDGGLHNQ